MQDKPRQIIVNKPMRVSELIEELQKQDQSDYVYTGGDAGALKVSKKQSISHRGVLIESGTCH